MAQQPLSGRSGTQGPRPNARFGPVTRAKELGAPLMGPYRNPGNSGGRAAPTHRQGNTGNPYPTKMPPAYPFSKWAGTQAPRPNAKFGRTQKRTRGVQ